MKPVEILKHFGLLDNLKEIIPFGTGLINNTWKIETNTANRHFILQRINTSVFRNPESIAHNIRCIAAYLQDQHPEYLFIKPVPTLEGQDLYFDGADGYFRVFPFINESCTYDVVNSPEQAYEAARQFALFTKLLSHMDAGNLRITLPDFHNLSLRYEQFITALNSGNTERVQEANDIIYTLLHLKSIVDDFEQIRHNSDFKIRVMHHDTKISNILFDKEQHGLCVIDLDTVMPGYFISDVGDMLRTYLSPVSEEEADLDKIEIRDAFFKAIVQGYLSEMCQQLTSAEKAHFVYAGKFMIYMQALRFLTDYLNNDVYYGARYEKHNLVRARNQTNLLQKLIAKEDTLQQFVQSTALQAV